MVRPAMAGAELAAEALEPQGLAQLGRQEGGERARRLALQHGEEVGELGDLDVGEVVGEARRAVAGVVVAVEPADCAADVAEQGGKRRARQHLRERIGAGDQAAQLRAENLPDLSRGQVVGLGLVRIVLLERRLPVARRLAVGVDVPFPSDDDGLAVARSVVPYE
jgi:hypothetical protein